MPTIPAWDVWADDFAPFATPAVDFGYPGKSATTEDAQHAVRICIQVRQSVRERLHLPK